MSDTAPLVFYFSGFSREKLGFLVDHVHSKGHRWLRLPQKATHVVVSDLSNLSLVALRSQDEGKIMLDEAGLHELTGPPEEVADPVAAANQEWTETAEAEVLATGCSYPRSAVRILKALLDKHGGVEPGSVPYGEIMDAVSIQAGRRLTVLDVIDGAGLSDIVDTGIDSMRSKGVSEEVFIDATVKGLRDDEEIGEPERDPFVAVEFHVERLLGLAAMAGETDGIPATVESVKRLEKFANDVSFRLGEAVGLICRKIASDRVGPHANAKIAG